MSAEPNLELIMNLAEGPEDQIDPQMANILREALNLSPEEVKSCLHKALDYGARYALASDFVMSVVDMEWRRLGGKIDDPAPWREEME